MFFFTDHFIGLQQTVDSVLGEEEGSGWVLKEMKTDPQLVIDPAVLLGDGRRWFSHTFSMYYLEPLRIFRIFDDTSIQEFFIYL